MFAIDQNFSAANVMYSGMLQNISSLSQSLIVNNAAQYTGTNITTSYLQSALSDNTTYSNHISDGVSLVQFTGKAVSNLSSKLDEMKGLAYDAANGSYTAEELDDMQTQYEQLMGEVNEIAISMTPDNQPILANGSVSVSVEVGDGLSISIPTADLTTSGLSLTTDMDLTTDASAALTAVEAAQSTVSDYADTLNSKAATLESAASTLASERQSLLSVQSSYNSQSVTMMAVGSILGSSMEQYGLLLAAQANSTTDKALLLLLDS